jgi:hypothetical protein
MYSSPLRGYRSFHCAPWRVYITNVIERCRLLWLAVHGKISPYGIAVAGSGQVDN